MATICSCTSKNLPRSIRNRYKQARQVHGLQIRTLRVKINPRKKYNLDVPSTLPPHFWDNPMNQRDFLDHIYMKLNMKSMSDWYRVNLVQIREMGGHPLLDKYDNYFPNALMELFPDYEWQPWRFRRPPSTLWEDEDTVLSYISWLCQEIKVTFPERWYMLSCTDISQHYGSGLIHMYGHLHNVLKEHFPEFNWLPWMFDVMPKGWFDTWDNQRRFMDWIGEEMSMKKQEDWYRLTKTDLIVRGGNVLVDKYGPLYQLMRAIFPEYRWQLWRFGEPKEGFWQDPYNQREWLDYHLKISDLEQWYSLSYGDIVAQAGQNVLSHYDDSYHMLTTLYPFYDWKPWLLDATPKTWIENIEDQYNYVFWLADRMDIQYPEQWYGVSYEDLFERNGFQLLSHHGSVHSILKVLFPDYIWMPWLRVSMPKETWDDKKMQLEYMNWVAETLNITRQEHWHAFHPADLRQLKGNGLLEIHGSIVGILKAVYPEQEWHPWQFESTPMEYWDILDHQRAYLEWLGKELQIKRPEDWHAVNHVEINNTKGGILFEKYGPHLCQVLQAVFPERNWEAWLFDKPPRNYFDNRENQIKFIYWFAEKHNIEKPSDFYKITTDTVKRYGGSSLLEQYGNTFSKTLTGLFPRYSWQLWRFDRVPQRFWDTEANVEAYIKWLPTQLDVHTIDDVYSVTTGEVFHLRGGGLSNKIGIFNLLARCYPEYKLDHRVLEIKASHTRVNKVQRGIYRILKTKYNWEIRSQYKHPVAIYSSGRTMELDLYIPSYSLAIEYQGAQHFEFSYQTGDPDAQRKRDIEKQWACKYAGITLIEIPYWWDTTKESLIATIHKYRPDLEADPGPGLPIPDEKPLSKREMKKKLWEEHQAMLSKEEQEEMEDEQDIEEEGNEEEEDDIDDDDDDDDEIKTKVERM